MAVSHVSVQPGLVRQLSDVPVWRADCDVQVTSLGSEAKLGMDFADVYASSQLAMCAPIKHPYEMCSWISEASLPPDMNVHQCQTWLV